MLVMNVLCAQYSFGTGAPVPADYDGCPNTYGTSTKTPYSDGCPDSAGDGYADKQKFCMSLNEVLWGRFLGYFRDS